jgi:regulator of sirC expression with transglutaminase-like and TPR domain
VIRAPAERVLLARVAGGDRSGGLVRAAVLLARTECPDADPDRVEAILEALAAEVRRRGAAAATGRERARVLASVLSGDRGLRGDPARTDDPRHSCPECVLDRRVGIPLALSLLWMETGRRAGWRIEGVGLPGHFVIRVHGAGGRPVLADPFHGGGVLGRLDLKHLLHALHGRAVPLAALDLGALAPRDLLLRMLRNLRASYRRRGDLARGLSVVEDMLVLAPGLPEALRDRGLLRLEAGDRAGGLADLRDFLDRAPDAAGSGAVLRLVAVVTDGAELPN